MNETMSGMGWFPILFVIIVIWAIFGGGFSFNQGRCGIPECGCGRVSNCEVEKQEIIDSAKTQYMIGEQGAATRAANQAGVEAVMAQNNRIYEQKLQETIFDLKLENHALKSNIFTKEQTDDISRRLDGIECRMLTKPQLSGVAATCGGQLVPAGAYGFGGYGTVIA